MMKIILTEVEIHKIDFVLGEYQAGKMSKSDKRRLVDSRDYQIVNQGYPTLTLRFHQIKHKLPRHGPSHGLPVNDNGRSPKSDQNAIIMRDDIVRQMDSVKLEDWYLNGQYQGETPRGCETINVYNPEDGSIVVFRKFPDGSCEYLTDCVMTPNEQAHFEATNGNFVTESVLENQQAVSNPTITNPLNPEANTGLPIDTSVPPGNAPPGDVSSGDSNNN